MPIREKRYFGLTSGALPPGVPGGGITGMLCEPGFGVGTCIPGSGLVGGWITPPERESRSLSEPPGCEDVPDPPASGERSAGAEGDGCAEGGSGAPLPLPCCAAAVVHAPAANSSGTASAAAVVQCRQTIRFAAIQLSGAVPACTRATGRRARRFPAEGASDGRR